MALHNFSLPFGAVNAPPTSWATISPIHASPHAVNNLYEPTGHHQENVLHNDDYYKNGPYRHHQPQQQQQQQQPNSRNYLPPHQPPQSTNNNNNRNGYQQRTRTYGESSYSQQSPTSFSNVQTNNNNNNNGFYNNGQSFKENPYQQKQPQPQTTKAPNSRTTSSFQSNNNANSKNFNLNQAAGYPERPPGFKPIQAGQGSRTQNGELEASNCYLKLTIFVVAHYLKAFQPISAKSSEFLKL